MVDVDVVREGKAAEASNHRRAASLGRCRLGGFACLWRYCTHLTNRVGIDEGFAWIARWSGRAAMQRCFCAEPSRLYVCNRELELLPIFSTNSVHQRAKVTCVSAPGRQHSIASISLSAPSQRYHQYYPIPHAALPPLDPSRARSKHPRTSLLPRLAGGAAHRSAPQRTAAHRLLAQTPIQIRVPGLLPRATQARLRRPPIPDTLAARPDDLCSSPAHPCPSRSSTGSCARLLATPLYLSSQHNYRRARLAARSPAATSAR